MKATIVCFSATGKNAQIAKALEAALSESGYESERVFLQPARKMGVMRAVFLSLFARSVELIDPPVVGEEDLLAIVGPVWAGSINPPVRTFLKTLPDLGGRTVINLVGGYNPHASVVREINHMLKNRNAGMIVSEPLRMRVVDTPEKLEDTVRRIAAMADSSRER